MKSSIKKITYAIGLVTAISLGGMTTVNSAYAQNNNSNTNESGPNRTARSLQAQIVQINIQIKNLGANIQSLNQLKRSGQLNEAQSLRVDNIIARFERRRTAITEQKQRLQRRRDTAVNNVIENGGDRPRLDVSAETRVVRGLENSIRQLEQRIADLVERRDGFRNQSKKARTQRVIDRLELRLDALNVRLRNNQPS